MTDSRIRKRITCACTALLILSGCAGKAPSSKPEETVSPEVSAEPAAEPTVTGSDAEQISENTFLAMEEKMTYYREAFEQTSDEAQRKELYEAAVTEFENLYFDACDSIDGLNIPDETKDRILDLIAEKWGEHVDEIKDLYGSE